jgi:type IV pilus assembly protein PilY1
MKTYKTRKYLISAGAGLLACMFTQPLLAAINLSNVPLIAATNVDPNMMFLIDTSGSMNHIVVDTPYDANTTYGSCPGTKGLSTSNKYYLTVASDGTAKISNTSTSTSVSWLGNTSNRCFTSSATYDAALIVPSDSGLANSLRYFTYSYKGNYLNWYFSNANQTDAADNFVSISLSSTTTGIRRTDTKTRMEVTKTSLTNLVTNSIRNAYVGLTIFKTGSSESDNGANVVNNLADINAGSNKSTLLSTINGLSASGGTPLASALAQLGRYFVTTDPEQELTFTSPNNNVSSPKQAYALFDTPPKSVAATPPAPADGYILKSCQKNFVITMTDGEPSVDSNYNSTLGKWADGDGTKTALNDFDDIAGALYDLDLRPDLGTDVKNNIVSYVIGFDKDLYLLKRAALLGNGIQPNPDTDSDPLVDSSGSTNDSTGYYFTASNTSELSTAFDKITTDIDAQDGAMSSVAFNSSQLEQNSAIYQATFNTGRWYGSLNAIPLKDNGDIEYDTQTPPAPITSWKAGDTLDAMTYTNRKIFTFDNTASPPDGKAFTWTNLNVNQKNDLRKDGVDSDNNLTVNDTDAENLLAYLIGDRTKEGTSATHYRTRESRLGDIVNSAPVFVGKPQMNWPDYLDNPKFGSSGTGNSYSDYKNSTTVKSRTPVVYVGANDGMLHGFNASIPGTGAEVFAYIPGLLYSNESQKGLHYLASQQYEHRFYVDLTPSVSDVFIKTTTTGSADWRTVLVGGLQAGGKGLFALDVSNPSLFSNPSNYADDVVLWEFDGSHADMGHVFGTPTIAMMANGKWAVISANGYDSSSGFAKLFIIFLEEGLDGAWTVNTDYIALDTGVGPDNGLSSARAIDFDGDSVVDMIYAGDLKGNMWAFDVSSSSTGSWSKRKLFTATVNGAADGVAQPITSTPIVALNPNNPATPSASYPNVLVMFGTGQYLVSDDNSSKTKMAYYAVWDNGASDLTRSNLAARIQATTGSTRTISGTAVDWSTQKGWYIDLLNNTAAEGERVVADSLLRRQVLFFNTIIPNVDDCETSGSGWLMSVQYDTGLAPGFGVFDGNNDGLIDSNDLGFVGEKFDEGMPTKSGVLGERQYTPGTKGTIEDRKVNVGPGNREGQLSWHEIFRD